MTTSRRDFLKLTASGVALAAAPLGPRIVSAQPGVKIGIAVVADYGLAAPVVVAIEKGFFEEHYTTEFTPGQL